MTEREWERQAALQAAMPPPTSSGRPDSVATDGGVGTEAAESEATDQIAARGPVYAFGTLPGRSYEICAGSDTWAAQGGAAHAADDGAPDEFGDVAASTLAAAPPPPPAAAAPPVDPDYFPPESSEARPAEPE